MPLLLTEAALEAHQKELEQEPQPVLLYGASSPRHSPQHQESPPAAKGGFAGFFGSLVSSIGKRGVLGGSKLSAQPSTGCASPLLKAPDVSQFSSFSHGSRLERFLTDAAKSAIVADSVSSGASHAANIMSKPQSKFDRSSVAPPAKHLPGVASEENPSTDFTRRRSLPMPNSVLKISPAISNPLPKKESGSSGNSRSNSASSLSSDDAIRYNSQELKAASAHALLSASIQVPTLSEIRSRISMLDDSRDKHSTPAQASIESANEKSAVHTQTRPAVPHNVTSVAPVTRSATTAVIPPSPPYAMLQTAPLTAISRSKWKQPSEGLPAPGSSPQGGWHYRSVKLSNSSPGTEPQSLTTEATACTPSWLKVEPSLQRNSNVTIHSSTTIESFAGTRPTRRHTVDEVSVPAPIISATLVELAADASPEKPHYAESSAAAQRRARHTNFVQSQELMFQQRLSPTKSYTKDSAAAPGQNEVTVKAADSFVSMATSPSGIVQGRASEISPGQVFSSLKVGASNLLTNGSSPLTKSLGPSSSTVTQGKGASHLSPGQVFSLLRTGASDVEADEAPLSSKDIGLQLSQDLSQRLERIQRTHSGQHTQQQKHQQQSEHLHFQRGSSSAPLMKLPAAALQMDVPTAPSLVSDSLQEFVSKFDSRASAISKSASRAPSANPDSVLNSSRLQEKPSVQSPNNVENGLDSLEAFVRNQSVSATISPTFVPDTKSSSQIPSDLQKEQLHRHHDLHPFETLQKQSQQVPCNSKVAFQPSESKLHNTSTHSLYRIDSVSTSLDEREESKAQPLHDRETDDDDCQFDNTWLFRQDVNSSSAAPLAASSCSPSTRALHDAPIDYSTSVHGRLRNSDYAPDATSWLPPAVPQRVLISERDEFDDFVGTFSLHGVKESRSNPVSKIRDDDDFVPLYQGFPSVSYKIDVRSDENDFTPSFEVNAFRPVPEGNSSELEAGPMSHPNSAHVLSGSARYITRDSQAIELLATAMRKVHLPNCQSLSHHALEQLLTPILRKFDLVAFASKVKIPTLMAADLVQLAPFNIHFLVDDSGDSFKNGTNWSDAQTLLQECVDFVSLVNSNGCTISFLSSSVSQARLKSKDQVAFLFARVISATVSNRFAAVCKPDIVAAFESKVLDAIFAGNAPALVYVLSLQDVKRDHLSSDRMLRVLHALDTRIAHSKLVPNFVRLSVANVGPGIRNGYSSLLSELRSHSTLNSRLSFIEDFEVLHSCLEKFNFLHSVSQLFLTEVQCDAAICQEQGVQLTPYM